MVTTIGQKAQALAAVAQALDGLTPEDALQVLDVFPRLSRDQLGAIASLAKDLGEFGAEAVEDVLTYAAGSIAETVPPPPERKARPRRASARPLQGPGRPTGAESEARLAFVNARGRVTLKEFAEHFGIEKDAACNWLKKAVTPRGWIAKGRREEYLSLAEAARRKTDGVEDDGTQSEMSRERLAFVLERQRVTVEDIRKRFDLPKQTAYSWLTRAADAGLIERADRGIYVPRAMTTPKAASADVGS